ncbi:MAG: hypothetical protein ABW061_24245 [Polyangiaceae bacterium]
MSLAFVASLAGCSSSQARHVAPTQGPSVANATKAPAVSPEVRKRCGSHADFGSQSAAFWVEDRRQRLCCSPRTEVTGSNHDVWHFVSPEDCVSRYAPGLILPFYIVPDAKTTNAEAGRNENCIPGVAAEVLIPTAEFEPQLDSGSLLRIESCVGSSCARAVIEFDGLARDDELLFALEGSSKAGALLNWNGGMVRFRVRVVQQREQVVEGERYRLTLELDGKPLRAIQTSLSYHSPNVAPAVSGAGPTSPQCPLALVTLGAR